VIADFLGYWSHRLFHFDPQLWRIHSVHHLSRQVDWLAAVRVHSLNDALTTGVQAVPLLLIGFNFEAFGGYVALLTLYAIFLHSNVPWSYGPLRYVVASPVFHRWHHTTEKEGSGKNFAGLLPVWDLAFPTFYMPEGRQPMEFGIVGEAVPGGVVAAALSAAAGDGAGEPGCLITVGKRASQIGAQQAAPLRRHPGLRVALWDGTRRSLPRLREAAWMQ